jgi:hypothetical protein
MPEERWRRVSSVAQELGLSKQGVRDLVHHHKLEASKDPEGRWLIDAASADAYLAVHGSRKRADTDMQQIERRLEELVQSVASLAESNGSAAQLLKATERERDKYRADSASVREAALRLVSAAHETNSAVSGLLSVLQQQQDALVQLLAPGSLDDLLPASQEGP